MSFMSFRWGPHRNHRNWTFVPSTLNPLHSLELTWKWNIGPWKTVFLYKGSWSASMIVGGRVYRTPAITTSFPQKPDDLCHRSFQEVPVVDDRYKI